MSILMLIWILVNYDYIYTLAKKKNLLKVRINGNKIFYLMNFMYDDFFSKKEETALPNIFF